MKSVVIRVPISPSPNYLNRMVFLAQSVRRSGGALSAARIQAFVSPDRPKPPASWIDHLATWDVEWNDVPSEQFAQHSYGATGIERFVAPVDADVLVLADADLIMTGSLDDAIERSDSENRLLGVTAYRSPFTSQRFPPRESVDRRTCWKLLFDAVDLEVPDLSSRHPAGYEQDWDEDFTRCPPYFNYGVLIMPTAIGAKFGSTLYEEHRRITTHFRGAHSGQLALSAALVRHHVRSGELPIRYNFPNQEPYVDAYPGDYSDMRILHYMNPLFFDKESDLDSARSIAAWLERPSTSRIHTRLADEFASLFDALAPCPWNQ